MRYPFVALWSQLVGRLLVQLAVAACPPPSPPGSFWANEDWAASDALRVGYITNLISVRAATVLHGSLGWNRHSTTIAVAAA